MKLYMHPVSTATRPVRLLIAENGIKCDEEMVDILKGAHYQEPYASINPNRMVPMLEDGDLRLTESSAILKYLADKYDLPSYPKDLKKRAKINEVMDWLNTQFYRDFGYGLIYPQLFPHHKRRSDEAHAGAIAWGQQGAKNWLQILNDHWIGPKSRYLCGHIFAKAVAIDHLPTDGVLESFALFTDEAGIGRRRSVCCRATSCSR